MDQTNADTQTNADDQASSTGEHAMSQANVDTEVDDEYQEWDDFSSLLDGVIMLMDKFEAKIGKAVMVQGRHRDVNKYWLLLDSESTVNLFCNRRLVKNIRKAPKGYFI